MPAFSAGFRASHRSAQLAALSAWAVLALAAGEPVVQVLRGLVAEGRIAALGATVRDVGASPDRSVFLCNSEQRGEMRVASDGGLLATTLALEDAVFPASGGAPHCVLVRADKSVEVRRTTDGALLYELPERTVESATFSPEAGARYLIPTRCMRVDLSLTF